MILLRRILHAYVESGPKGLLSSGFRKLTQRFRGERKGVVNGGSNGEISGVSVALKSDVSGGAHPFDVKYGTDTGGLIPGEELSSGRWNDLWNTAYYGISTSGFDQMFEALDLEWPRFTFVDMGSGKGRALLLASRFPFRRIVGVEIAKELSETAAANVKKFSAPWQRCRDIETHTGDAAEFNFPAGPFVLFLYQPFLAPVMKRCVKNLARSLAAEPREVYVVYVNPVLEREMKRVRGLERVWDRTFAYSDEDRSADRVGAKGDRVVVYRFLP